MQRITRSPWAPRTKVRGCGCARGGAKSAPELLLAISRSNPRITCPGRASKKARGETLHFAVRCSRPDVGLALFKAHCEACEGLEGALLVAPAPAAPSLAITIDLSGTDDEGGHEDEDKKDKKDKAMVEAGGPEVEVEVTEEDVDAAEGGVEAADTEAAEEEIAAAVEDDDGGGDGDNDDDGDSIIDLTDYPKVVYKPGKRSEVDSDSDEEDLLSFNPFL